MARPNLFDFATSELSQDAFLCWLCSWADDRCKKLDPNLHAAAIRFLHGLVDASKPLDGGGPLAMLKYKKVRAFRQEKRIDIRIEIDDSLCLLIEDKIDAWESSGQLCKYAQVGRKHVETEGRGGRLFGLFLKTGNDAHLARLIKVNDGLKGWGIMSRAEVLSLLEERPRVTNTIFVDYLEHMRTIECETQSYKLLPIVDSEESEDGLRSLAMWGRWPARAWEGFFLELQDRLIDAENLGWGYVHNANGGFMGLWFGGKRVRVPTKRELTAEVYLQISGPLLEVKVKPCGAGSDLRRVARDAWSTAVCGDPRMKGLGFKRPSRMGSGQYMTVANLHSFRARMPDGTINLNATEDLLKTSLEALRALQELHSR